MQGIHCTSDAPYVLARLGPERAGEGAYVWQKLMKTGAVVSNGTDAPVEDVSPIASYYATVSRRSPAARVLSRSAHEPPGSAETYTINAATRRSRRRRRARWVGKFADVVVLSKDILGRAGGARSPQRR